jgi:ABC-2 type transport system permease protein
MNRLLVIALREFRMVALRPRFLIFALFPILIGVISAGSSYFSAKNAVGAQGYAFLVIDGDGALRQAVSRRTAAEHQLFHLQHLAPYLERNHLSPPQAWGSFPEVLGDTELRAFQQSGGIDAAVRQLAPKLGKDMLPYPVAPPYFVEATVPANLSFDSSAEQFDEVVGKLLGHNIDTAFGPRPLGLAAWFPKDGGPPHIWLMDPCRPLYHSVMDEAMRQRSGRQAEPFILAAHYASPRPEASPMGRVAKRGVGMALCYLTFIIVMLTGGMLLQATMEEKAGRLMESLLSIATPGEILGGKLAAMGAVALLLAVLWSGMAVIVLSILPAQISRPAFDMLAAAATPGGLAMLLFNFLAGYLLLVMPYLTIGAMCETIQDAQPFQMPLMLLIMPLIFVLGGAISNPDSHLLGYLMWVPPYTPFVLTARIGEAIPLWQSAGATALLLAFLAVEYRFMIRVFRAVLLRTGQSPKWREVMRYGLGG